MLFRTLPYFVIINTITLTIDIFCVEHYKTILFGVCMMKSVVFSVLAAAAVIGKSAPAQAGSFLIEMTPAPSVTIKSCASSLAFDDHGFQYESGSCSDSQGKTVSETYEVVSSDNNIVFQSEYDGTRWFKTQLSDAKTMYVNWDKQAIKITTPNASTQYFLKGLPVGIHDYLDTFGTK